MKKNNLLLGIGLAAAVGCATQRQQGTLPLGKRRIEQNILGTTSTLPPAIVYKTTRDYASKVPVTMNDSRTEIVSYPAPSDIVIDEGYATPLALAQGYLLDRRGINKNTAFLDYTYAEYAQLGKTPGASELKRHIVDNLPISEIYQLPISLREALKDTALCNKIIRNGFKDCQPMERKLIFSRTR